MATVVKSIGTALGSAGNGVVTLTSGSTTVTGSGTDFTSKFTGGTAPPQAVEIPIGGGTYYTVKSVESDTSLTLVSDPGVSASMQSWKVGTRDYSSIAAWDADLDNTNIYSSNDTGQGECYADSAFSQSGYNQLNGGITVGLAKIILTVPVAQRHDGTADSGAKVNLTSGGRFVLWYKSGVGGPPRTMEWLELDGGDSEQNFGSNSFIVGISTAGYVGTVSHLLVHGCHNTQVGDGNMQGIIAGSLSQPAGIFDNIVYDCSGRLLTPGISSSTNGIVCNNTVYKIGMTYTSSAGDGSREAIGILCGPTCVIKNNIAIGTYFADDGHSHEKYDYLVSGGGAVGTYNISGDSTASGSNSITGESISDLFVSTTGGSEDLHLKSGAAAIGAGDDLGTSVTSGSATLGGSTYGTEINIDIDGRDRDSEGDDWDIGADQFVGAATTNTAFMFFVD